MIWIPILGPEPQKQSVLSGRVGNMFPACLFVSTACLFVIWLVCLGFRAYHSTSTTGRVKNIPDPTFFPEGHYGL